MRSTEIHFKNAYQPFRPTEGRPDLVRPLGSHGGVEDRLRLVAFAELQARDLFRYGCERFAGSVPPEWVEAWSAFAGVEEEHAQILLSRMEELGVDPAARSVSSRLSRLCRSAEDPPFFLFLLASAEERGMEAGIVLGGQMRSLDPGSAALFSRIAEEEKEHVAAGHRFLAPFPRAELQERAKALSRSFWG